MLKAMKEGKAVPSDKHAVFVMIIEGLVGLILKFSIEIDNGAKET